MFKKIKNWVRRRKALKIRKRHQEHLLAAMRGEVAVAPGAFAIPVNPVCKERDSRWHGYRVKDNSKLVDSMSSKDRFRICHL